MAESLDPRETVSSKELLISNMIEIQALAQLLMEKGIITEEVSTETIRLVSTQDMTC